MPSQPASLAASANALSRHHGHDDPRAVEARRDHAAAVVERAAERVVATAPALRDDQIARITAILRGGAR